MIFPSNGYDKPVSSIGDAAWEAQMLGELHSLELDAVGVDGSEVVMRLLCVKRGAFGTNPAGDRFA